jgi:hypothetical protein
MLDRSRNHAPRAGPSSRTDVPKGPPCQAPRRVASQARLRALRNRPPQRPRARPGRQGLVPGPSCDARFPPSEPPAYHQPQVPRLPRSPSRAALLLALGASLALPPAPALASTLAFAPSTARQQSERLLAEGDAALAKERWDEAISKYRASYYGLPTEDHASYLGSLPVRKAMRAYTERVAQEQDPGKRRSLLQRQRVLLEEFLDAVAAKPGATDEVGPEVIAELEETRRSIDAELDPPKPIEPTEPTTPTNPFPEGDDDPDDPGDTKTITDDAKPPRDWLGLGLVIGGSTLLVTGIGVSVGRWTIRSGAQDEYDADPNCAPGSEGHLTCLAYLETEEARAKKFLIAGSVVAGVGLATAIAGVVHIVIHRKRSSSRATALRVAPVLSPTAAGLSLGGRF